MPNRDMEMRHLAQADRHIAEGELRVQVIRRAIARNLALGANVDLGRELLDLVTDGLSLCRSHRRLILQAIADVDRRGSAQAHG